jgi:hypothetical protein
VYPSPKLGDTILRRSSWAVLAATGSPTMTFFAR